MLRLLFTPIVLHPRPVCQLTSLSEFCFVVILQKMVHKHHVEGYENFCKFMKEFDSGGQLVHIYFSGSKLGPNGQSWCDDCIRAWPVIESELAKADPDSHFIYVEVGDRITWKDPNCPFRKDPKTKLMVLPTIVRWKGPQKLEGEQLEKPELVAMLFQDED